ncbi:DNA cytosine methyltransferase [Pacificispira sp.]|uniref:DNA cytosine methyltransferase n=1 Tax=Pacificispira sp. TaxID=2888761 RepID=UPI003BAB076C
MDAQPNPHQKLRILDLFSGIGGFSLGLERTGGFETAAFCEIEKYPRSVLAKRWPGIPVLGDVREVTHASLGSAGLLPIDVICGGFPCQDLSVAGSGVGLAGARSGLWSEIARLTGELRPSFVLVENVAALTFRGLGTVLGDLAEIGYDAEWHCIPASALGAPHRRDRIWILAYPSSNRHQRPIIRDRPSVDLRRPICEICTDRSQVRTVSDPHGLDCGFGRNRSGSSDRRDSRPCVAGKTLGSSQCDLSIGAWFASEPDLDRLADGIPYQLDRLRCLGNSIVPQVVEWLGRSVLSTVNCDS